MEQPATIAMPQFLEQVGRELTDLAVEIERLQDTFSERVRAGPVAPRLVEQAQALDHVYQHAAELSAILARAAEQAPPRWQMPLQPILAAVSLSGLVRRLTGHPAEAAASGELEVF